MQKRVFSAISDPVFSWWHPEMSPALVLSLLLLTFCTWGILGWLGWTELITLTLYREDRNNSITHLCMNSMILSLLRSCGSVYFSSPFSKYLRVGKPEILKRSPTALCTVASTAANVPGLCEEISIPNLKSQQLINLANLSLLNKAITWQQWTSITLETIKVRLYKRTHTACT